MLEARVGSAFASKKRALIAYTLPYGGCNGGWDGGGAIGGGESGGCNGGGFAGLGERGSGGGGQVGGSGLLGLGEGDKGGASGQGIGCEGGDGNLSNMLAIRACIETARVPTRIKVMKTHMNTMQRRRADVRTPR